MSELLVEKAGSVMTLTLNRPDKMNALSPSLVEALLDEVASAEADGARLLVLKGAGRNFSAGFDLGDFEQQPDSELVLRFIRIEQLLQRLYHAPFDTLALAHGRNFGAGVDIICACARRVADKGASFQMPGLKFGLVLGTRRYAGRVGQMLARRILQDGIAFNADEALAAGFLNGIVDRNEWPAEIGSATRSAEQLSPETQARLFAITSVDTRDADLAELVRSAAEPGLKARIRNFRNRSVKTAPSAAAAGEPKKKEASV